ncbi:hypothetical protein AEAC466_10370 [Asticcacaulis sp. AC466]|nr:hypothetical protein AEAC466_10370 [Asticcacaulis sp. AC466]
MGAPAENGGEGAQISAQMQHVAATVISNSNYGNNLIAKIDTLMSVFSKFLRKWCNLLLFFRAL